MDSQFEPTALRHLLLQGSHPAVAAAQIFHFSECRLPTDTAPFHQYAAQHHSGTLQGLASFAKITGVQVMVSPGLDEISRTQFTASFDFERSLIARLEADERGGGPSQVAVLGKPPLAWGPVY